MNAKKTKPPFWTDKIIGEWLNAMLRRIELLEEEVARLKVEVDSTSNK
jgi:uncharacterized protein (UPF0335 family)